MDPARRLRFHSILVETLGIQGNVYFQPPETIKMRYPAIVYNYDQQSKDYADNGSYRSEDRYEVTHIDRDPLSLVPQKISSLPKSTFVRRFVKDDLNQTIFNVYF